MTIEELIVEGQKLQTSKLKSAKDNTRYHTWTNNCITYLEQIKFSQQRRNLFLNLGDGSTDHFSRQMKMKQKNIQTISKCWTSENDWENRPRDSLMMY